MRFPVHNEILVKIRSWVWKCLENKNRLEKEGKFCGFIWFVLPKIVINIKKLALIEKLKQKKTEKKEKKDDNQSDQEDMDKDEDDGEDEII